MSEKIYKAIKSTAVYSLVLGICILITGVVSGTLLIISGSRLLKQKSKILL